MANRAALNKEEKLSTEEKLIGKISAFFEKNLLKVVIAFAVLVVAIVTVCVIVSRSENAKENAMLKTVEFEKRYNELLGSEKSADYDALISELLENAKDSSYASVKCQYLAGLCYYDLEDYQKAYDAFMKAYEMNKTIYLAPLAKANAAACAEANGDVNTALDIYNGISSEFGDDASVAPKALFNVARIYLQQGNDQLAKTTFEQVWANYPSSEYGKLAANIANVM